jgi:hypothetical protein
MMATRAAASRMPGPFPMRALVVGAESIEHRVLERANRVLGDERLA